MTDGSDFVAGHFDELDAHLRHHGAGPGLAEIHGMACGLLCGGRGRFDASDWLDLVGEGAGRDDIQRVLDSVFSLAQKTLGSTGFEFRPLLPGEASPVSSRLDAVADWCSGFDQAYTRTAASPGGGQAGEALEDIRAMAGIVGDDDDEATQRSNLAQVEEHLRIAAQLLFEESR